MKLKIRGGGNKKKVPLPAALHLIQAVGPLRHHAGRNQI